MSSEPQDQPSLKRKADAISTGPPIVMKFDIVPIETPARPSGPIPDDETWESLTKLYNKILAHRSKIIEDDVAAGAAHLYNPTDLAKNVALAKEKIMMGIKNAMVWSPVLDRGQNAGFAVMFRFDSHVATIQVLRVLFPGIGIPDQRGMFKGWDVNFYSLGELRNIMGTEIIARMGFYFADLSGLVKVVGVLKNGLIGFAGSYHELRDYPESDFPDDSYHEIAAARR